MDPYSQKNTRWGGGVQGTKIIHPTIQAQQQLVLQQQLQQQQGQIRTQIASAGSEQRVFTGTVTKVHDNFGFIDDDVFFQLAACEGKSPAVGDRVLVDAQYNPNMPFKWNASRVQVIVAQSQTQQVTQLQNTASFTYQNNMMQTQQQGRGGQAQSLYSPQLQNQRLAQQPPGLKFSGGHGGAGLLGPAPVSVMNAHITPQRVQQNTPKRNAPRQTRERRPSPPRRPRVRSKSIEKEPRKRRSRTPPPRRRSPSPVRRRSVSSEKVTRHPIPRYLVQYAKYPLTRKTSDVLELASLFPSLYIPSDFTNISYAWLKSVPLQHPLTYEKCQFHIMNKDVERLEGTDEHSLDPTDASHLWTARVMLLQVPGKEEFYKQCCSLAEDKSDHFIHPTRLYQFLLGYKSKKEPMAIGGMWSPSLDGPDPASNPRTLINTAIRTCKALTGIDLSKCTKWYRIAEIQYHRAAEIRKSRSLPERLETTVMFLPDVYHCMSTAVEYSALRGKYLAKYETVINREDKSEDTVAATANIAPDVIAADTQKEQKDHVEEPASQDGEEGSEEEMEKAEKGSKTLAGDEIREEVGPTLTPLTDVEIKTLKVDSLRKELEARGLSPKGLKSLLVTRLTKAVKEEVEKREQEKPTEEEAIQNDSMDVSEAAEVDEKSTHAKQDEDSVADDKAQHENEDKEIKIETGSLKKENHKEEKELKKEVKLARTEDDHRLKRHYTLPESKPSVVVHPSTTYRKGKFECATASLFNLLNYRQEDNKESMFEVSVFAEAFKEILQRDFAFTIYESLVDPLPEIKIEKEDDAVESREGEERKRSRTNEDDEEPKTKKSKSVSEDREKGDEKEKADETPKERSQEPDKEEKSDRTRSGSRDSKDSKQHDKSSRDKDTKKSDRGKSHGRHSKDSKTSLEKMVTVRPELLLACVYFDRTHCGYIRESDLTDIIHTAGLHLSRSQLTKFLAPSMARENFFYRKITDIAEKQRDAFRQILQAIDRKDRDVLAVGNKNLISTQSQQSNGTSQPLESEDGFVIFKGALVDIGSLMEKLKNTESNRVELESSVIKLQSKLDSINKDLTKSQKDFKALESDYEAMKKKNSESQSSYKSASDWKTKYEKTLKNIVTTAEDVLPKHPKKE